MGRDVLPLLVATDGAIKAFGYDGRRLRPNLVIAASRVSNGSTEGWRSTHQSSEEALSVEAT
jgi:hypothetical protein